MQLYEDQGLTTAVGDPVVAPVPLASAGYWNTSLASATLQPAQIYWLAVATTASSTPGATGPWSNALPIIYLGAPTVSAAQLAGRSLVMVWQPPAGTNLLSNYQLSLLDANSTALSTALTSGLGSPAATAGSRSASFELSGVPLSVIAQPQATAQLAPVYVDSVTQAISIGPTATVNVYLTPPLVVQTSWQTPTGSNGLQFGVTALNQDYGTTTAPSFLATVYNGDTPIYGPTLLTSTFATNGQPTVALGIPSTLPFFGGATAIPAGLDLSVALAQGDGTSAGPAGARAPLLVGSPSFVAARYAAGSLAVAIAYPPGVSAQAAAQVTVWQGATQVAATTVVGASGAVPVTLASGTSYTAQVALLAGQSLGPPSAAAELMSTAPLLSSVSYDGETVVVTWPSVTSTTYPGLLGLRVQVLSGGVAVASEIFSGTSAALAVPGGASQALSVQASMVGAVSQGPSSLAAQLVTASPTISTATTDPSTGVTTVSWGVVTGATSYSVQLYVDGAPSGSPISASGASYTPTLTPNADQAIAVAAVVATTTGNNTVTVTGPYSAPFALPTTQVGPLRVSYNGATVQAGWTPAAGASGYTVSVYQSGTSTLITSQDVSAPATTAVVPVTIPDTTQSYVVFVQATVNGNSGPAQQAPLFAPAFFLSTAPASTASPFLFPATALSQVAGATGAAATLYLPDLGNGTALTQLPYTEGPFTLSTSSSNSAYPYALTIAGTGDAWTFSSSAIRAGLQAEYQAFLQGLESRNAVPQGIATVQQVIARYMPQTFLETLYYSYGLDLSAGTADLRPGMILRVVFNDFMTVSGGQAPQWLNGYVGGPQLDYEVGSYLNGSGGWAVGFDAFIAQLVAGGALTVQAPLAQVPQQTAQGLAEAADLFYAAFNQPFYRLFVPSQLQSPSSIGTTLTSASFVLAAAESYTLLSNAVNVPTSSNAIAYFRGRAVVKLCIRVTVNGVDHVVPIGTTVGNILDRMSARPGATAVALAGIALERELGPVALDASAPAAVGQSYAVRLDWGTLPQYASGVDGLSLPLLHGDRLAIFG